MDTLSLFNWNADQRRYVAATPLALALVQMLRNALARTYDAQGIAVVRRVLLVVYRASVVLQPPAAAPIAHHGVYSALRRAVYATVLAISAATVGTDGPILTEAAQVALVALENTDPLVTVFDRPAALLAILDGLTWRNA